METNFPGPIAPAPSADRPRPRHLVESHAILRTRCGEGVSASEGISPRRVRPLTRHLVSRFDVLAAARTSRRNLFDLHGCSHPVSDSCRDRARGSSRASPSSTRARTPRTRSPPAPPRRRALDAALAELDAGAEAAVGRLAPRVLAAARARAPAVRGGAARSPTARVLSAHQVDALSGHADRAAGRGPAHARRTATAGDASATARYAEEPTELASVRRSPARRSSSEDEGRARRGAAGLGGRAELDEDAPARGAARGPQRRQALLVRARDRRRQDRRRARLRRGLAHRRRPDPHPPPQPRRPVPRRAARPRLRASASRRRCSTARTRPTARSRSRPTSGSCATPGRISDAYTIVICDEAHTALGEKTSRRDPQLDRPDLHRHDRDGRADRPPRHRPLPDADLALRPRAGRAPRRDRAAALRPHPARARACARSPRCRCAAARSTPSSTRRCWPSCWTSCRSTWRSPTSTRRASTACPASSTPPACATPTTSPRRSATSGIKAQARLGRDAQARAGARSSPRYERGDIDVLVNAQLLAEGWNSPRATVCMHLAPTASKRIYQQRVGRVTRRHPGKEAGIVVDFVHPATKHDDPVVTLHSLLDRDVYRGGAIVVGPVRRGRGRRLRVERRVLPVTRRREPAHRGLRARAVADRRRAPRLRRAARVGGAGRRARGAERLAPRAGDAALRPRRRAQAPLPAHRRRSATRTRSCACARCRRSPRARDAEAFDRAIDIIGGWPRDEKREGVKVVLQALAEKRIGRRDQANNWIWRLRRVHPRGPRGVRGPALAGDQAAARPARELLRRRPRAQRPAAGARRAQAGPPPGRGAARRGARAHARGRGGHQRRPHAHVAQAGRAGPRAAAQLPQGPRARPSAAAPQGRAANGDEAAPGSRWLVEATEADGRRPRGRSPATGTRRRCGTGRRAQRGRGRSPRRRPSPAAGLPDAAGAPRPRRARRARRWCRPAAARPRRCLRRDPGRSAQATSAPAQRVARRGTLAARRRSAPPSSCSSASQQPREHRLDRRRARAPASRPYLGQLGRAVVEAHGDVDADPDHCPALLRAASTRIPATLRPSDRAASLGHLTRASSPTRRATATAAASGSSAARVARARSEHSSAAPGGRGPAPALAPRARVCSARSPACRAARRRRRARGRARWWSRSPRRCTRGVPSRRGGAGELTRAQSSARRRRRSPRVAAASPRLTASASRRRRPRRAAARRAPRRRTSARSAPRGGCPRRLDRRGAAELEAAAGELGRARRRARCCRTGRRTPPASTSAPSSSRARGSSRRTSRPASTGSPPSPSAAPAARRAATGAKMSRPWNVADTGSSRNGERAMSTASDTPPKRSAASAAGRCRARPSAVRRCRRGPRPPPRSAPTSGSTTARCTPAGR